jgi:pimeloyl-ACP methyl ester carboxylesterase/quercetin dioxygenase-like cupin family protein
MMPAPTYNVDRQFMTGVAAMLGRLLIAMSIVFVSLEAGAAVVPFPPGLREIEIVSGDATLHVRVGGRGPAVVMLHGFGDTGDMWAPLAHDLISDHTVVIPDLRGMGLSSHPQGGYDKRSQAADIAAILDQLDIRQADLVTHDIGNMVGYALAALFPDRVTRWVAMDAPLPGIGDWEQIIQSPLLWHFNFRGPDVERLVQGRERIYLDRFWDELSANPNAIDEATREHYAALYARPGAMHCAFEQFAAFSRDAVDNKAFVANGKLTTPILAIGAEKSFGTAMADQMRFVALDVTGSVIANSGHWLMEEQPAATVAAISTFLRRPRQIGESKQRLTPADVAGLPRGAAGAGTSGVDSIETTVLLGDPTKPGIYTIALHIPANTVIVAHTHRDDRVAMVVSGTWYFGYGVRRDPAALKSLPAGSFYTEPAGEPHFAETKAEPVTVYITGHGPTDTVYVEAGAKPSIK